ncbi:MAG: hypothetical protein EP330_04825 [Deltaproteobacteria bacterium]|nr:MAG: hypothetical protein EP330_04825 [Deltaproteobacteria bacterium]
MKVITAGPANRRTRPAKGERDLEDVAHDVADTATEATERARDAAMSAAERTRDAANETAELAAERANEAADEARGLAAEMRDSLDDVASTVAQGIEDISLRAMWRRATDEMRERALSTLGWTMVLDQDTPTAQVRPVDGGWKMITNEGDADGFVRKRDALNAARDWAREREGVMVVRNADGRLQKTVHYCR